MPRVSIAAILALVIAAGCTATAAGPTDHGAEMGHGDHMAAPSATEPARTAEPTSVASPSTFAPPSAASPNQPAAIPDADGIVEIAMTDAMRFEPNEITVRAGDSIRFVVTNVGVVPHEAIIGTPDEQRDHAEEMAAGEVHYHANGVLVEPGDTGEFETWFPAGQYLIACHLPGHYEAGMVGLLNVVED